MLNGNEWQQLHEAFLCDSQALISRADECLSHLELIGNDQDATECLLNTLQQLASNADTHGVEHLCGFARRLRDLLDFASAAGQLHPEALAALKRCLALLAWQVELIDPNTGLLPLEDNEQKWLLEEFGCLCGLGTLQDRPAIGPGWSMNTEVDDLRPGRLVDEAQA